MPNNVEENVANELDAWMKNKIGFMSIIFTLTTENGTNTSIIISLHEISLCKTFIAPKLIRKYFRVMCLCMLWGMNQKHMIIATNTHKT